MLRIRQHVRLEGLSNGKKLALHHLRYLIEIKDRGKMSLRRKENQKENPMVIILMNLLFPFRLFNRFFFNTYLSLFVSAPRIIKSPDRNNVLSESGSQSELDPVQVGLKYVKICFDYALKRNGISEDMVIENER